MVRSSTEFQAKIYITTTTPTKFIGTPKTLNFCAKQNLYGMMAKLNIFNINAIAVLQQPQHVTHIYACTHAQRGRELQQFEFFVSFVSLSMMSFEQNAFVHPLLPLLLPLLLRRVFLFYRIAVVCMRAHVI